MFFKVADLQNGSGTRVGVFFTGTGWDRIFIFPMLWTRRGKDFSVGVGWHGNGNPVLVCVSNDLF